MKVRRKITRQKNIFFCKYETDQITSQSKGNSSFQGYLKLHSPQEIQTSQGHQPHTLHLHCNTVQPNTIMSQQIIRPRESLKVKSSELKVEK